MWAFAHFPRCAACSPVSLLSASVFLRPIRGCGLSSAPPPFRRLAKVRLEPLRPSLSRQWSALSELWNLQVGTLFEAGSHYIWNCQKQRERPETVARTAAL